MSTRSTKAAAEPQPAAPAAESAPPQASTPAPWRRAQRALGNAALAAHAGEQGEGGARLHTDVQAAALAQGARANAFTRGRDVYFGAGRFAPETHEGRRLLRHELAHVTQSRNAERSGEGPTPEAELEREARAASDGRTDAVVGRAAPRSLLRDGPDDPDTLTCSMEPPVTMPEPATCEVPAVVPTSITISPPTLGSEPAPGAPGEERIELGVPVESAEPVILYAVPTDYVFATEAEAAAPVCRDDREETVAPADAPEGPSSSFTVPPVTTFGGIAWTAHGPIEVVYVTPDFVVTTSYVKFATGAAAMTLVNTSEGLMLVDAGVQIGSPNGLPGNPRADLAAAAVRELVRHVAGRRIVKVLVTHQHADHINLLPQIAEHIEIGTIQITAAQAEGAAFRSVLDAVEQAQARYRMTNLPARIRAEMAPERDAWLRERTFTDRLTPERAEVAWQAHVDARIQAAQAQVRFPTIELLIGGTGGQPILIEAELHRTPGEIEARVPSGTQRGGTITQPLRQGSVTTFTQPDADAARRFHPDTHSANYILDLPDGTQLVVVADPRDRDLVAVRENFERALAAAGREARFRIVEATHHMQRGMLTEATSGPRRGHLVSNQWLVDAATMLAEIADQRGPAGGRARSAVVVGGAESRISPGNIWLMRSLGFEAYVTTDARTVEMLSILDAAGERLTGLTGAPRAGGRPSEALVMRAGLEIASVRQRIQALDAQILLTNDAADVQARTDLQTRLADTRRLLHDYMDAFNQEIGRSSTDTSRPTVAPAAGVEPGAAARTALVSHLDRIGAAEATPARLAPLSEPVLVLIDRGQAAPLTPQHAQIRQHLVEIERIRGELEAGTPAAGRRVHLLGEMEGLRQLLRTEVLTLQGEEAAFFQREIARLDASITSLEGALHVETQTTPDPASGGRNRTRIIAEQPINPDWSLNRQRLEKGFGVAGRGFGAVMVMQTISAQSGLNDRIGAGDTSVVEALAGTAHNVHGFTVGVRMARLMPVHFGEFVVLAVLDFTATAAADYDSRDEARSATAYSAFSNALNLALFAIGGAMMRAPNPWVAGAGLVVMMLGEPILRVSGAAAAFERWMSFEPGEVTGVEQKLRDLMSEYRIVVGALELSRRDVANLKEQGASDPAALRQAALDTIAEHRESALELEPRITGAFESGYTRAGTSYSGLSGLDTMREAFADLRARVWADTDRASGTAADDALLARFQTMDANLDLSAKSAEEIQDLEQWGAMDAKMNAVHGPLFDTSAEDIDWPDTLEDMRELERMFQNARYRLDPAAQGTYRLVPLLAAGSAARTAYEGLLRPREERYSRCLVRLASLGGGATLPAQGWQPSPPDRLATPLGHEEQLEPGAPNPGMALTPEGQPYRLEVQAIRSAAEASSWLRTVRRLYEGEVLELAAAFDRTTLNQLWGSSVDLEGRYAELLERAGLEERFHRLQARETALAGAMGQARSFALLDQQADPELTLTLGEELQFAQDAIHDRRHDHGLIFENEIAAARSEIRRAEEGQVALILGGALARQIGPLEGEALRSDDELESIGRDVTSARSQLGRLSDEQARSGGGALQLYTLDARCPDVIDAASRETLPIVGWTGDSHEVTTFAGHMIEKIVIPINAAAIRALGGPGRRSVSSNRLWSVSVQQLAAAHRAGQGSAAPGTDAIQRAADGPASVPPRAAVARALGDRSPGRPLPAPECAREGRRFGTGFEGVRLHTDSHAASLAKGIEARAFTRGNDIYFGAGRFAPHTEDGQRLLGHELAHVAQHQRAERTGTSASSPATLEHEARGAGERSASGGAAPVRATAPGGPAIHRDDGRGSSATPLTLTLPDEVPPWAVGIDDPMARYPMLKLRAPRVWKEFAQTAQYRDITQSAIPVLGPVQAPERETLEAWVPVAWLIEPQVPRGPTDDLRTRLWPLLTEPDPYVELIADEIRAEIAGRWADQNQALFGAQVRIRLVDDPAPALEFDIEGEPIATTDGSLSLLELDLLGSNNLEEIVAAVQEEATVIARAGDFFRATSHLLDVEAAWWSRARQDWDTVSKREVEAHYRLFLDVPEGQTIGVPMGLTMAFFLEAHPEFGAELGDMGVQLAELTQQIDEDRSDYLDYFDSVIASGEVTSFREGVDEVWDQAGRSWDDSALEGGVGYVAAGLSSALYHISNTVAWEYPATRHQGMQAFKRGDISMDQLDELSDAARMRGAAVGAVMVALTIATAGLAGPVLGTAASVGSKMAFYGLASAGTSLGMELTGTGISAAQDFEDPTLQGIWKQGVHSPGQIAANTLLGGAVGAAGVPLGIAFGKLVSFGRGAFRRAPALDAGDALVVSRPGALRAPPFESPGWQAEEIAEGVWRYTRPDLPGEVIVAGGRARLQVPSGDGMLVVADVPLDEGAAAFASRELGAGAQPRALLPAPEPPAAGTGTVADEALPAFPGHAPPAPVLPAPAAASPLRVLPPAPAPAPAVAPPLSPTAAAAANLVWVNVRNGVYHLPGSRWYGTTAGGRYMTVAQARATGYRRSGFSAPSGVYRVTRPTAGDPRIEIEAWIQASQARSGFERQMASASEYGLQQIARWQRGHTMGAGLGAETAEAIRLETAFVNQQLKRLGVERTIRERFQMLAPGERLHLTTATHTHEGTMRLKLVEYRLEIVREGGARELVFEADIGQGLSGRATWGAEMMGEMTR